MISVYNAVRKGKTCNNCRMIFTNDRSKFFLFRRWQICRFMAAIFWQRKTLSVFLFPRQHSSRPSTAYRTRLCIISPRGLVSRATTFLQMGPLRKFQNSGRLSRLWIAVNGFWTRAYPGTTGDCPGRSCDALNHPFKPFRVFLCFSLFFSASPYFPLFSQFLPYFPPFT